VALRQLTPALAAAIAIAACLVLGGCGAGNAATSAPAAAAATGCPQASRAGWQRLANEIGALVYCPAWMPRPLDAVIGGRYANGRSVDKDRSYLVSFVWLERDVSGVTGEVHVNLRGYPGRTAIPVCQDILTVKGKTLRKAIPCFSDARGTRRIGGLTATVYTANQGADEWHVLLAWRRDRSLYSISQHVAPPYSYEQVVASLEHMLRSLVPIEPAA
jgi:hypothetical protein